MQDILAKLEEDMELRGFKESSKEVYRRNIGVYLRYIAKPVELTSEQDIRNYSNYLFHEKELASTTINSYLTAVIFLYEVVCNRRINRKQVPYRKRPKNLPRILSKKEVIALIDAVPNTKHKAILMLAYSAGLRRCEIARLKTKDIDSESMCIFVRDGKGGKERYTLLSKTCLEMCRRYWRGHKPDNRDGWLFPSNSKSGHLGIGGFQYIFDKACEKAQITKQVSFHSLRHSFATHLLESGVSVFDVKKLLGHAALSSTAIYLHVTHISDRVISPLDIPLDEAGF